MILLQENHVSGHGRLTKPASRASAWRFGFNTPKDYDDVSTHCGHYKHFDKLTPPWCNICGGGGTVHGKGNAKKYLAPGKFATGTITGDYVSGGTIKLKYHATNWGLVWYAQKGGFSVWAAKLYFSPNL